MCALAPRVRGDRRPVGRSIHGQGKTTYQFRLQRMRRRRQPLDRPVPDCKAWNTMVEQVEAPA
jgi:hypothetical protein